MESSLEGHSDEVGCFVYKVLYETDFRNFPNTKDDTRIQSRRPFKPGQYVSIDLRRVKDKDENRHDNHHNDNHNGNNNEYTNNNETNHMSNAKNTEKKRNGPYLRLSDGSGWLFETKEGEVVMERVLDVEVGLWCFYADNYPSGIGLRSHPNDIITDILHYTGYKFLPMQKLYCDRKFRNEEGVNFYRVQGSFGWVFDKRRVIGEGDASTTTTMLNDETLVKKGLMVYRALQNLAIRNKTNVGDESKTSSFVNEGSLISVDCIRESDENDGNGPFLRLSDGSGWLFEHMNYEKFMEPVPIEKGNWLLNVTNPVGITIRSQPIDSDDFMTDVTLEPGEECLCDRKIQFSPKINFYRVKGRNGWVFDFREEEDYQVMEVIEYYGNITEKENEIDNTKNNDPWTLDFVRGIASAIEGVNEIEMTEEFIESRRVISFRNSLEQIRINVYYTTKTVGTCLDHPRKDKSQLFRKNCTNLDLVEIMRNPQVYKGSQRDCARIDVVHDEDTIDAEIEIRYNILKCDESLAKLRRRKAELLKSIKEHDEIRHDEAEKYEILRSSKEREEYFKTTKQDWLNFKR